MGKGKSRQCRKKYRYSINRSKLWKKSKRLPGIVNEVIRMNWVCNKNVKYNLKKMGLSDDPNASIKIPNTMALMKKELETAEKILEDVEEEEEQKDDVPIAKTKVIDALEKNANRPKKQGFHVSIEISMFAKYMTEKYGKNYKAMSKDPKNYYQLTPKQIKNKIKATKKSQMITATRIVKKMSRTHLNDESDDTSQ